MPKERQGRPREESLTQQARYCSGEAAKVKLRVRLLWSWSSRCRNHRTKGPQPTRRRLQ